MSITSFLLGDVCKVCTKRNHKLTSFRGTQTCKKCVNKIEFTEARIKAMNDDKVIECPMCSTTMNKNFMFDDDMAIRDKCPSCETVVFSKEEIQAIKEHHYNEGHNDGHSSGSSSGIATGYVIGSMIN